MARPKIIKTLERQRGFTLIEMMVAMVVGGIVISGIFAFSSIQQGLGNEYRRNARAQDTLQGAMSSVARDIQMAGLGWTRTCTEIRIWDNNRSRLLNPGSIQDTNQLNEVALDELSKEPFWVLRDGIQAFWRSEGADSFEDYTKRSASLGSAADSVDVVLGEGNFAAASGAFTIDVSTWKENTPTRQLQTGDDAAISLISTQTLSEFADPAAPLAAMSSNNANDLAAVQQLFPPGSFALVVGIPEEAVDHRPDRQSQCALVQITGDVSGGTSPSLWNLPVGRSSDFNANLEVLLGLGPTGAGGVKYERRSAAAGGTGDWDDPYAAGATIVPMGYLRWSRYEIDYSVESVPYLVRTDIIGWVQGDDTIDTGVDYPSCNDGACPKPQLRLPTLSGGGSETPRLAIAPNIEDMQVAVGCDGYTADAITSLPAEDPRIIPVPDLGFEEKGGVMSGNPIPNVMVDEWDTINQRDEDEWVGNARSERWAPDCVYYGTGENYKNAWLATGITSEVSNAPGFRMSPQVVRVSLMVRAEANAFGSGDVNSTLGETAIPIEDRPRINAFVPNAGYVVHTERFSPPNLRFRDPTLR